MRPGNRVPHTTPEPLRMINRLVSCLDAVPSPLSLAWPTLLAAAPHELGIGEGQNLVVERPTAGVGRPDARLSGPIFPTVRTVFS